MHYMHQTHFTNAPCQDSCRDNSTMVCHWTKWTLATDCSRMLPKICRNAETCRDTTLDAGTLFADAVTSKLGHEMNHMSRRRKNVCLPILTSLFPEASYFSVSF